MSEDFQCQAQLPGSSPVAVSSRGWLEMRSRVQNYVTPVRFLWAVAGIHDCLRAGKVEEARARCMLLLAQGDQLSIDRGSWIVASELALEPAPPMASFAQHNLPTESEPPYTRLIDGRWFDLFLQKLQDYDTLTEKKKKLGAKRIAPASSSAAPAEAPKSDQKPDPKKKGKSKGKGKTSGGGSPEAEEPPATTAA